MDFLRKINAGITAMSSEKLVPRFCRTITVVIGFLSMLASVSMAAEYRYTNPVVFQRFENTGTNIATPDVPGFYGGASIWVMESDGSRLSMLRHPGRGPLAKHLDHPSVTSDGQFVIYAEFDSAEIGTRGIGRLYQEDLQSGERTVLREKPGCSLHHAALSLDDEVLTYSQDCSTEHLLVTEVGNMGRVIEPVPAGTRVSNGLSAGNSVVYQNEKPNDQQSNRTIAIILTEFDNQGDRIDRNISSWEFRNRRAAISQDGGVVAWQTNSTTGGGKDDILLLDLTTPGAVPQRITQSPANDGHPFFSRDGKLLLFESDRTGNWEIFKLHILSGTVTQLTDDSNYVSTRPRW